MGGIEQEARIAAPRRWRADSVGTETNWRHALADAVAHELIARARDLARDAVPLVETALDDATRVRGTAAFGPIRDALESGLGFAVVAGGAPAAALEHAERLALYWIVGQLLGEPVPQNVQGVRLYDVRDTGQTVSQGARFSVTNAESTFHTDASFEDEVVDYVGLLCLRTARSGGISQLVNGHTVVSELAATEPDVLRTLQRPFHVDRRGGVRPGEAPTAQRPVIEGAGAGLLYRYLRTWIEVGHDKVGLPLSASQTHALDAFDRVLNRPDLRAEFLLAPGDMFFMNNRWLLHNRTMFEDHPEPARRRHYVRLWLRARAADDRGE